MTLTLIFWTIIFSMLSTQKFITLSHGDLLPKMQRQRWNVGSHWGWGWLLSKDNSMGRECIIRVCPTMRVSLFCCVAECHAGQRALLIFHLYCSNLLNQWGLKHTPKAKGKFTFDFNGDGRIDLITAQNFLSASSLLDEFDLEIWKYPSMARSSISPIHTSLLQQRQGWKPTAELLLVVRWGITWDNPWIAMD